MQRSPPVTTVENYKICVGRELKQKSMISMKEKSITEINERIKDGKVKVMTAEELSDMVRAGEDVTIEDVDVVTTGTCGIMSGTAAILSFFVGGDGYRKIDKIWLNGVEGYPGPCPNESIGVVDLIIYGTNHSRKDDSYGGGHLFSDIVSGKKIEIEYVTDTKKTGEMSISVDQIPDAKMLATRSTFKNYNCFVNPSNDPIKTIFHVWPMKGNFSEASFCGCGELNPIQNDPDLMTIGIGTRILYNGAVGHIISKGTRCGPERPNLMLIADMKKMNQEYMGGFKTSISPEVIASMAIPIPILYEKILKDVMITNQEIPLPILNISDRKTKLNETTYADVYDGSDFIPIYHFEKCIACKKYLKEKCPVEDICPSGAFKVNELDEKLCFGCGACKYACKGGAVKMNVGSINVKGHRVPVTCRQSNMKVARAISENLKKMIQNGGFLISGKVDNLF